MNTSIKFSYKRYKNLLKKITKKRTPIFFDKYKSFSKPFIIIRHDIEYFVDAAFELAKIEFSLGIKSTFFFLLTSNYNLFSERNSNLINKIKGMGHRFGIHYDAYYLNENKINLNENLKKQINIFENFFKVKINAISCHRPKLKFSNYNNKKIFNVYNKEFQRSVKYFSDSQQVFREDVEELIKSNKNLHLLIHDYTWSSKNDKWEKNIMKFYKKNSNYEKLYFKRTINDWQLGLKMRKKKDLVFKKKVLT